MHTELSSIIATKKTKIKLTREKSNFNVKIVWNGFSWPTAECKM